MTDPHPCSLPSEWAREGESKSGCGLRTWSLAEMLSLDPVVLAAKNLKLLSTQTVYSAI